MNKLEKVTVENFITEKGEKVPEIAVSYEVAGCPLHTAPIVMVCHALTGNSSVSGPDGWWGTLMGAGKVIDTGRVTIIAFNIPGNGYDGVLLDDPTQFSLQDVARIFLAALHEIRIDKLDLLIGASLGGALVWHLSVLAPSLAKRVVPIACDYKATDWVLAQTHTQELLLENSKHPLNDARVHAMLCYRSPKSINDRFRRRKNPDTGGWMIDEWLDYHGRKLEGRFALSAYKTMTYLTKSIHAADSADELKNIRGDIHIISIESDLLFPHYRAVETAEELSVLRPRVFLYEILSPHGHDAFLMEYAQMESIIKEILNK